MQTNDKYVFGLVNFLLLCILFHYLMVFVSLRIGYNYYSIFLLSIILSILSVMIVGRMYFLNSSILKLIIFFDYLILIPFILYFCYATNIIFFSAMSHADGRGGSDIAGNWIWLVIWTHFMFGFIYIFCILLKKIRLFVVMVYLLCKKIIKNS